jgi:hypothetical protein
MNIPLYGSEAWTLSIWRDLKCGDGRERRGLNGQRNN